MGAAVACAMFGPRAALAHDDHGARSDDDVDVLDAFREVFSSDPWTTTTTTATTEEDDDDGDLGVVAASALVVKTTGFHGELSCAVTLPRLSPRATVGVAFTLPRGLVADRDDVRSKIIHGWTCDAYGDVNVETPASRAGTSRVVCVKALERGARDGDVERATTTAHARYGAPRIGGGVVDVFIEPVRVAVRRADGAWMRGVGARGETWTVPVGDARDAASTRMVGSVANALGACVVILVAYTRTRERGGGRKMKAK